MEISAPSSEVKALLGDDFILASQAMQMVDCGVAWLSGANGQHDLFHGSVYDYDPEALCSMCFPMGKHLGQEAVVYILVGFVGKGNTCCSRSL